MKREFVVECPTCGTVFTTNKVDKLFCKPSCKKALLAWRKKREEKKKARTPRPISKASQRPDYEKWKARKAVELALRYKKIERPTMCPVCYRETEVQAHHLDYSQPLLIEWLCRSCHKDAHSGSFSSSI